MSDCDHQFFDNGSGAIVVRCVKCGHPPPQGEGISVTDELRSLQSAMDIYERVHEEMDGGDGLPKPYEEIDNGLINGGEKMSYEAWRGYMTQTILNRVRSLLLNAALHPTDQKIDQCQKIDQ